ncbi:KinB-signaling pathway activation protein [Paenibacillus senegalensis]|uniref:KinB-signaling pathway activation protein n=1 Tax=Paenibacillus senegalensis TaxID=1465766 RepID=UPI0002883883|nr:KinB-signaling pathway activation protein [Paenibacillus senegalensis]
MFLKRVWYLLWTTSAISLGAGMVLWGILKTIEPSFIFMDARFSRYEVLSMILGTITIAIISLVGFLANLFARYYFIGIFKNRKGVWTGLQIFFILLAVGDLFYLRYKHFAAPGESMTGYLIMPLAILAVGIIVALWKSQLTNGQAFIPTLFFMVVLTILEAIPAFQANDLFFTFYMLALLLIGNAWQILIFHKLVDTPVQAQKSTG